MNPIETIYNGRRFRSRVEARWAVFFDALGVKYEYEKEGYKLPSGPYLADFWLPDYKCWIEIKGQQPLNFELKKAEELRDATTFPVCIFAGEPDVEKYGHCYACDVTESTGGLSEWPDTTWAVCNTCNQPGLTWGNERSDREVLTTDWKPVGLCKCPWSWNKNHTRIKAAVLAAKQSRFEHGESGI
jgi:hypothetical protein